MGTADDVKGARPFASRATFPSRPLALQGLLYHYLNDFVEGQFGHAFWDRIRERAAVPERSFLPMRQYPDRYAHDLVSAIAEELGPEGPGRASLMFEYGRHVGRCFERDFAFYFRRFASAREMIAGIEPVIHTELRRHDPASQPPRLRTSPTPGGGLRLLYSSERRLCQVVRGLATQVGEAFGQTVGIEEPRCMHRGDDACELLLTFAGNGSPRSAAYPP